jgi:hypothetical protein
MLTTLIFYAQVTQIQPRGKNIFNRDYALENQSFVFQAVSNA